MEETTEKPVKRRGGRPQSQEHMAQIAKKGAQVMKMKGAITAYEKARKKKEIEEKFAMIQAELAKSKLKETEPEILPPEQSNDTNDIQQQLIEEKRPPSIKKKPKKIVEVIEVEDDTDEDEEEEVIVKRIIKKKQNKKVIKEDKDDFIKQTNLEMLKNKFNEDIKRRIASSLFDD